MLTAAKLLALPDDELGRKIAEVLTPGPWKHEWDTCGQNALNKCQKCGKAWASSSNAIKRNFSCSVPDAIDINDRNVAMTAMRKCNRDEFIFAMWKVSNVYPDRNGRREKILGYCVFIAQPKHYLIAAALAAGKDEE